jgi:hypothetical protein
MDSDALYIPLEHWVNRSTELAVSIISMQFDVAEEQPIKEWWKKRIYNNFIFTINMTWKNYFCIQFLDNLDSKFRY